MKQNGDNRESYTSGQLTVYNRPKKKTGLKRKKRVGRRIKRWFKKHSPQITIIIIGTVILRQGLLGVLNRVDKNDYAYMKSLEDMSGQANTLSLYDDNNVLEGADEIRNILNLITEYSLIYGVNPHEVYQVLAHMTDNFTSGDFYELRIPGIVCKQRDVEAESLEELLLLAVRNIKQIPDGFEDYGLDIDKLYVDTGYETKDDYFQLIEKYSNIFHIDPCLVLAIFRQETGFDSDLLRTHNNPAGLIDKDSDDGFWKFANLDQGMIELCAEIAWHYYPEIGCSRDEVTPEIIAQMGTIHCPVEEGVNNGNDCWVENIVNIYVEYRSDNPFDKTEEITHHF